MTRRFTASLAIVPFTLSALACGSADEESPPGTAGDPSDPSMQGGPPNDTTVEPGTFDPPPPAEGMTRIVAPMVEGVEPGDDVMFCQYVLEPFDHDVDILSVDGHQGPMGHHIVAFATTADVPVGTTRLCQGEDNFSGAFLGAVGGEAGAGNVLPEGVAFRLPAGSGIMLNTHYLNTTSDVLDGEGVIDIEFVEVADRKLASFFVNINMAFALPPQAESAVDATCVVPKDMEFIAFSNHLHDYGANIFTEVTRAGTGDVEMIRNDPTWSYEMQFAAEFARWDVAAPLVLHAGDEVRTRCTWNNTSSDEITFPREMCVGSGFYLTDEPEFPVCMGGNWVEGGASDPVVIDGPPCASDGALGNDVGVGQACTTGGGECGADSSVCLADYTEGSWGNFCTRLCSADADCGTGAVCGTSSDASTTRVCIPDACVGTATPVTPAP